MIGSAAGARAGDRDLLAIGAGGNVHGVAGPIAFLVPAEIVQNGDAWAPAPVSLQSAAVLST